MTIESKSKSELNPRQEAYVQVLTGALKSIRYPEVFFLAPTSEQEKKAQEFLNNNSFLTKNVPSAIESNFGQALFIKLDTGIMKLLADGATNTLTLSLNQGTTGIELFWILTALWQENIEKLKNLSPEKIMEYKTKALQLPEADKKIFSQNFPLL